MAEHCILFAWKIVWSVIGSSRKVLQVISRDASNFMHTVDPASNVIATFRGSEEGEEMQ